MSEYYDSDDEIDHLLASERRERMSVVCKRCGEDGFTWTQTKYGWRLTRGGQVHKCANRTQSTEQPTSNPYKKDWSTELTKAFEFFLNRFDEAKEAIGQVEATKIASQVIDTFGKERKMKVTSTENQPKKMVPLKPKPATGPSIEVEDI